MALSSVRQGIGYRKDVSVLNDIEMIRDVGMGIAVDNAIPEVKNVAREITLSGKEDGVAVALERYFLA